MELAGKSRDVSMLVPRSPRFVEAFVDIPPFSGVSVRPLITIKIIQERLSCNRKTVEALIRDKMIYPQPIRGRIKFTEEEYENYLKREQLRYRRKHA